MSEDYLSISDAARELSFIMGQEILPRKLTSLFYSRRLPDELGLRVGGRRLIKRSDLEAIAEIIVSFKTPMAEKGVNHG